MMDPRLVPLRNRTRRVLLNVDALLVSCDPAFVPESASQALVAAKAQIELAGQILGQPYTPPPRKRTRGPVNAT